ncbi:hypothetical protein ACVGVM_29495 (plasmid) [Pseudonocardia bannensis]|uniref:DNA helicase DnaB-like N-terminal domain-containing protein n=1 Tax=Pseudonocardia bannensis TaxID=630973 RepID=A0A848DQ64_9PSEU|nr:hypothetical protein [Pseudonocardia bannensis]NMH94531.1 hypothetical protein [Pseudonocardia bannensis]
MIPQHSAAARAVTGKRPAGRACPVRTDKVARACPPCDQPPPQDLIAEQSVLSGILLSEDAIADVVEVRLIR